LANNIGNAAEGLTAQVYNVSGQNNAPSIPNGASPILTTIVPNISFNWGGGGVLGGPSEDVIVVFTGSILSDTTQNISFMATADDGTRLFIDGVLVTSDWFDKGGGGSTSTPIAFTAGTPKSIQLMYYENGGGASVNLFWNKSGSMSIVPPLAFTSQGYTPVPPKTIGAPRNLTVLDNGSAAALAWEAPNTGNTQPERYAISFTCSGCNGWGIATGNSGSPDSLKTIMNISYELLEGLMPSGTIWTFSIRSDNDTEKLYSENSNSVTLKIGKTSEEIATEKATAKAAIDAENARLAAIAAEAARLKAEADAKAAEEARLQAEAAALLAAKQEAARLAAIAEQERLAEIERQRLAALEAARIEAERQAAIKAEQDRLAAEAAAKAEADRLAAEAAAKKAEEERLAAEAAAKAAEEARIAAEKAKAEEEARLAEEARLKAEADAKAAEEARLKAEADAKAAEEKARLEAEKIAAEKAKAEAEAKSKAEEKARLEAEKLAAEKAEEERLAKIAEEAKAGKELSKEEVAAVVTSLVADLKPGESISAAQVQASGVSYSDLPASTPVEVRTDENGNALVITAEVAANIELVQDPGALLEAAFSDPGAALQALGSIGADMTEEEREEATEMVIATVVAAGAAINAAAVAAGGATGGGTGGGGSSGGGSGANSPGSRGGRKW
jgi:hypothetical protein